MTKAIMYAISGFLLLAIACKNTKTDTDIPQEPTSSEILVGKGPDALFLTPSQAFLYVANVEDSTISVIDLETDEVVHTINGVYYPWGFTRLGQTDKVAVSTYDKQVVVIDFTSHQIVQEQVFDDNLGGITSNKDGSLLYVVSIGQNQVLQLNATSLEVINTFSTGQTPDGIGISKDENKLFVTNTADGSISVIDINSAAAEYIQTGGKPELVHANQDHSLLYISNFFENKIHIVNTETGAIENEIENIKTPEEAVLSMDEKLLYVVSFDEAKVFVYDAITYEKQAEVFETGTKPIGIIPMLNKLYVSNYGDNTVSVIKF